MTPLPEISLTAATFAELWRRAFAVFRAHTKNLGLEMPIPANDLQTVYQDLSQRFRTSFQCQESNLGTLR